MSICKIIKNCKNINITCVKYINKLIQLYLIHHFILLPNVDFLFILFKDVMADANILQGVLFHNDVVDDTDVIEAIIFS